MLTRMKKLLSKGWPWIVTLLFGVAVLLFWWLRYPFALAYQEQFQLFLFDDDYLWERLSEPGGTARYIAEMLVQFYNSVAMGAVVLSLVFMLLQRLTWRVMCQRQQLAVEWYALSFLPAIILWYAMGDESVLLTYAVALVLALASMLLRPKHPYLRWTMVLIGIPIVYWLIGPMVVLVALWWMPLSVIYAAACILLGAYVLPFPWLRLVLGISYYRMPVTLPYVLMLIPLVVLLLAYGSRYLPQPKRWTPYVLVTALAGLLFVPPLGFDAKKYELIEYDYLVRIRNWNAIIAKAERQLPDLPMSVSATNLALAMTNQLGERAFDFYQRTSEGLLPKFERNFATTQLTGEIYFHLGLVSTAQHYAFEAMEAIPNYNKSGRVIKRLAETNLINGQYKVAEKYLNMLEKTIFYRRWAQRTRTLLGDEKAIAAHPLYGTLRNYRLQDDFLFSDQELDKMCGQLFMHNNENQVAAQYLLMMPLLDRDLPRFMQYAQYVQSKVGYNPRAVQEAIALAFAQQRQPLPQGLVSPLVQQRLQEFVQLYSAGNNGAMGAFKNTAWYYLMVGK